MISSLCLKRCRSLSAPRHLPANAVKNLVCMCQRNNTIGWMFIGTVVVKAGILKGRCIIQPPSLAFPLWWLPHVSLLFLTVLTNVVVALIHIHILVFLVQQCWYESVQTQTHKPWKWNEKHPDISSSSKRDKNHLGQNSDNLCQWCVCVCACVCGFSS